MGTDRWTRTRRMPGLVAVLCLSLVSAAAAPVRVAPTTGRVAGHVRDDGGHAVAYAQVTVVGTALSALTDTAGAYVLTSVPAGKVTLRAARVGFTGKEQVAVVAANATTTADFVLSDQRRRAHDEASRDAANASALPRAAATLSTREDRQLAATGGVAKSYAPAMPSETWRWQKESVNN